MHSKTEMSYSTIYEYSQEYFQLKISRKIRILYLSSAEKKRHHSYLYKRVSVQSIHISSSFPACPIQELFGLIYETEQVFKYSSIQVPKNRNRNRPKLIWEFPSEFNNFLFVQFSFPSGRKPHIIIANSRTYAGQFSH